MNEHLVPKIINPRVAKPSSSGAHVYLTRACAPRSDLNHLDSQSESPRLNQRFCGGRPTGFTLIEVITTIVVLAIAATALLSVYTSTVRGSADPMIQQQAVSIAEAYMEEILLKAFNDPDGISGEPRPDYDDVQDFNALPDTVVRDQNGNAIGTLSAYIITVTVAGDSLNGMPAVDSLRIDISVDHPAIDPILLSGYRTNY